MSRDPRRDGGWSGQWVADRLGLGISTLTITPGAAQHCDHVAADVLAADVTDLVGLAIRRNPRRAHLLVSRVLGKHLPTDPALVYGSGLLLGALVRSALGEALPAGGLSRLGEALGAALREAGDASLDSYDSPDCHDSDGSDRAADRLLALTRAFTGSAIAAAPVVLGYAETATALGHAVADALDAPYLHSTRRPVPGFVPVGGFEEEHSHATRHLLLPEDPDLLSGGILSGQRLSGHCPLVLVDDELSTGTTALNTITALHHAFPRTHYVVAALVDLRSAAGRDRMSVVAADLGVVIDVVALATGQVELPADVLVRGGAVVAAVERAAALTSQPGHRPFLTAANVRRADLAWPVGLPDGGRHGFTPVHRRQLEGGLPALGAELAAQLDLRGPARVLVLGTEELMYAPLRLAAALAARTEPGVRVLYSTTTRSPVLAVDEPGYAIRTRLEFGAHDRPATDEDPGCADSTGYADSARFAYNVAPGHEQAPFDAVVVVLDEAGDTDALHGDDGLLTVLATATREVVVTVIPSLRRRRSHPAPHGLQPPLPAPLFGPSFGSYDRDEVGWLLTDLSDAQLEAPTEEREEAIQSGGAHYAESLPVEYQPSEDYQRLFVESLHDSAARVAHAVGLMTELSLAARGDGAVLVSLARAGTPIGILMRRWATYAHGLDLPHYAVSIVRGRGIDAVALRYLASRHHPRDVMFVDGWTGKGAITRELAAALARHAETTGERFNPQLAVLADPGRCVELYGTRDDYLIPSACLNSTVSGLVSRTVLNDTHIGPGQFHGAKFYADLAGVDRSRDFLDAVTARFDDVAAAVGRDAALRARTGPELPTWDGWRAVERISQDYGIGDINLVKPGVGETTRVLLRRVPWKVLVSDPSDTAEDLRHIRLLAAQRNVPVETVSGLPYSCVGLIHPKFTRGATGSQGTAVAGDAA